LVGRCRLTTNYGGRAVPVPSTIGVANRVDGDALLDLRVAGSTVDLSGGGCCASSGNCAMRASVK
jgi:hypothetical protein